MLLDWEKLASTNTWVNRTVSLTNYAGQTVFLFFQQNDGGQSSGEARYIDNVAVLTEGTPLYLPDAPKLLTVTATNCANLLWRDNDGNESGFKIERSAGTNGAWIEIASVSSNVTSYTDTSVSAGTNYSYRLRSWNAAGYSAYSTVRAVTLPDRPSLAIVSAGQSIQLSWPSWATNFSLFSTSSFGLASPWTPVPNPVTNLNGRLGVVLPLTTNSEVFQLRSP